LTADIKPGEMIGGLVAGDVPETEAAISTAVPNAARPSTSAISARSYTTRNPATNPCRYPDARV
jgi:hypothetical protein